MHLGVAHYFTFIWSWWLHVMSQSILETERHCVHGQGQGGQATLLTGDCCQQICSKLTAVEKQQPAILFGVQQIAAANTVLSVPPAGSLCIAHEGSPLSLVLRYYIQGKQPLRRRQVSRTCRARDPLALLQEKPRALHALCDFSCSMHAVCSIRDWLKHI